MFIPSTRCRKWLKQVPVPRRVSCAAFAAEADLPLRFSLSTRLYSSNHFSSMGKRTLRDDEHFWMKETVASPEIKDLKGTQTVAATTLAELYRARWKDPRPAETDAAFEARRKKNKNVTRYKAETKEECQARLASIIRVRYTATPHDRTDAIGSFVLVT